MARPARLSFQLGCDDGAIRQQLVEQLTHEIMNYDASSRRRGRRNGVSCTALKNRNGARHTFDPPPMPDRPGVVSQKK
jgi:hypothetical protein